jgi:alpha-L-rhamnosidase
MGKGIPHRTKEALIRVDSVDIDGRINPIGIDLKTPTFHYTTVSSDKSKSVLFRQIVVKNKRETIWDSGKILAENLPYVTYTGPELQPKTQYSVSVRVWDEENQESPLSSPVSFETGLLDEGFHADWVEPEQADAVEEEEIPYFHVFHSIPSHYGGHTRCRPAQNIRKSFLLKKEVRKARIYASAHGVYQLYVNGSKAGDTYLEPGISSYEKYLYYQTYDVTGLLVQGENVVAVTVADGWWIGRIGLIGSSCQYGKRQGIILQMEVEYSDGSRLTICSDESFLCHESEIVYADLYIGEKQDNNKEQPGWKTSDFVDTDWKNCMFAAYPKDNLIGQPIDGIREYQNLKPVSWITTPKGECLVDFGQVTAGTVEITVDGHKGQEITLEYCEVLDKEGNYLRNIIGRNKDQTDLLICRDGIQTWKPAYTYHGFRYVKLSGVQKSQVIKIQAVILTSLIEKTGEFNCSDELLTQLQQNIVWSERGNMISIPTDCPQREKMGWAGDIQIFAKTGAFNYNLRNFLENWLKNLRAEVKENGAVPIIIPNFPKQEWMQRQMGNGEITSSGWSDTCILLPWYLYQCYGDTNVLKENLNCMRRYLEFVKGQAALIPENYKSMTEEQRKRNPYLWNTGYHFGDWLIPSLMKLQNGISEGRAKTRAVVGSCWYAVSLEAYIKVCQALEQDAGWELKREIVEKEQLLKKIRQAIRDEYVDKDGTVDHGKLQGRFDRSAD